MEFLKKIKDKSLNAFIVAREDKNKAVEIMEKNTHNELNTNNTNNEKNEENNIINIENENKNEKNDGNKKTYYVLVKDITPREIMKKIEKYYLVP